tara:strand:+ start:119 stop:451 length:333 start_codon:yes stop_codon:yes gene_type:complete
MKDDGFMKMIFTALPMETELAVELRCREVMDCDDLEKLKAFCIDMMKNHAKTEVVLSKAMMKVVELEAQLAILKARARKTTGVYKILWWAEQLKLNWKHRKIIKRQSHKA